MTGYDAESGRIPRSPHNMQRSTCSSSQGEVNCSDRNPDVTSSNRSSVRRKSVTFAYLSMKDDAARLNVDKRSTLHGNYNKVWMVRK